MKRREFLKSSVVVGTAGVLLDACTPPGSEQIIPILIPEEQFIPGVEEFHATLCTECPGGCGLLSRKIDGRLVKVEGNPAHPISQGGSCARGQALPQVMYHPDRLASPLVREGARGEGRWTEISWDDALERLATELSSLDGPTSLAFLTGQLRGHRATLVERFAAAFGGAHRWAHEPFGDSTVRRAHALAVGRDALPAHDLEHANYVVTFGAALVEASRSPVRFGRGLGHLRRGRPGQRGKLVAVGPHLSVTAARADEWLPARPGSDAALALGFAHVLVRDGRHDERFVTDRATGFDAFRERLLSDYSPETVAGATGVAAEQIERVAHEMADYGPTLAVAGDAAVAGSTGLATALAVTHLNALLGAFDREGGVRFDPPPPFAPWSELPVLAAPPESETEADAAAAAAAPRPLVEVLADPPADVSALLVSGANPFYTLPAAAGVADLFAGVPFVAAFASFADETTRWADLILPEPTTFERFDDDVPAPGVGRAVASLSGPVFVRPLHDTRSMPDVLLQVGQRLGDDMSAALPWDSYEDALQDAWAGLHDAQRGSVVESTAGRFWRSAIESGGWWDAAALEDAAPVEFGTPDGRYQFDIAALTTGGGLAATTTDRPFLLHVYPSLAFGDGRSAHLPFLQELADPMTGVRWGSVVEVSHAAAEEHGLVDGDAVVVASAQGELQARVRVVPGLRPEVVAIAAGQGHTDYGRYATDRGANPLALLAPPDPADGAELALVGTAVSLRKIDA
ncbi:MAG: molybdopterin-dependent oxidoreductase [Vicinamibacterales bacterium]|nr:hypothetical protein [Acidobacteriota bacterium]MDP6374111.1 molybdopterin-dependent oxidoreductase [Vicinamibacterales bacterium]